MEITFKTPNKNHEFPFFRYQTFSVCKIGHQKYPELVKITRAPKWGRELLNKQYLDEQYAVKAIDLYKSENIINKAKAKVVKNLERNGYDTDSALLAMSEERE